MLQAILKRDISTYMYEELLLNSSLLVCYKCKPNSNLQFMLQLIYKSTNLRLRLTYKSHIVFILQFATRFEFLLAATNQYVAWLEQKAILLNIKFVKHCTSICYLLSSNNHLYLYQPFNPLWFLYQELQYLDNTSLTFCHKIVSPLCACLVCGPQRSSGNIQQRAKFN